jgi:calpain
LIQLRNPWGDETEWRGAWGDDSKEWTQKRKNAIYQHMRARGFAATEIGVDDGIFWISLTDFFLNFNDLYLCRFFDDEWQGIDYDGSWSVAD